MPVPHSAQPNGRGHRRDAEQGHHERQAAVPAVGQEPPRVRERAGEQDRVCASSFSSLEGGHEAEPGPVEQPGEQHARDARTGASRPDEVVEVPDRQVLAGLADPGQVLELVHGHVRVGAGEHPALVPDAHEHARQRRHAERGEGGEHGELEAVEAGEAPPGAAPEPS